MRILKIQHVLAAATLLSGSLAQKLKIMPLGDSITEITCWRTTVWGNLVNAGVANQVDFVGSMSNNPQNCQSSISWDMNHEGHSGYLAINIANTNLQGWLQSAKPDIIMFMLGTNDVAQGRSTTDIIAAFTRMVQLMRASNPKMRIIVDLVIPLGIGSTSGITALNNAIGPWVTSQTTTDSPIVIADCSTGYPSNGLRDGVHPNAAGDALIASRITPVLLNQIQLALGSGTTTTTTSTTAGVTSVVTTTTLITTTAIITTTPTTTTTTTTSPRTTGGVGSPMWGQCGGMYWTGPTTCAQGTCKYSNPWYSQCL